MLLIFFRRHHRHHIAIFKTLPKAFAIQQSSNVPTGNLAIWQSWQSIGNLAILAIQQSGNLNLAY